MKYYFAILFFVILGELNAQTIITDRPDQTESSSTVEKGSLQIESGMLVGFSEETRQLLVPSTLFRLGLTDWLELRVLNQFENVKNEASGEKVSGISDLELGTKIQIFRKEDVNAEVAFLSHLIIPTGSKLLTNDKFGTINKLSISHEISKHLGIGYNVGYNYFGEGKGDLTYSLALGIGITEKVSVYLEPYGDLAEFEDHIANVDAGLTYLLRDNFQLDFSFGTGINHTMNYISLGFSWNIKRMKKDSE